MKDDLTEMISMVTNNAEYLSNIVTNTLSISRLDTGKTKLELKDESMFDVISEVIAANEVVFKDNGVKITNSLNKNLPHVYIDRMRIRELLNNLISNAMKFMSDKKELIFDAIASKEFLTVSVKDSGLGIEITSISPTINLISFLLIPSISIS